MSDYLLAASVTAVSLVVCFVILRLVRSGKEYRTNPMVNPAPGEYIVEAETCGDVIKLGPPIGSLTEGYGELIRKTFYPLGGNRWLLKMEYGPDLRTWRDVSKEDNQKNRG